MSGIAVPLPKHEALSLPASDPTIFDADIMAFLDYLEVECGLSANTLAAFDLSATRRELGYDPQYNVQDFFDEPISSWA